MAMSKKHYRSLAMHLFHGRREIVGESASKYRAQYAIIFDAMLERMCNDLASDNPRFDRDRFLNACGYMQPVE